MYPRLSRHVSTSTVAGLLISELFVFLLGFSGLGSAAQLERLTTDCLSHQVAQVRVSDQAVDAGNELVLIVKARLSRQGCDLLERVVLLSEAEASGVMRVGYLDR